MHPCEALQDEPEVSLAQAAHSLPLGVLSGTQADRDIRDQVRTLPPAGHVVSVEKHTFSVCLSAMPGQSCSLDQQPVHINEQPVPAPTTPQVTETPQALGPLCQHPEPSGSLAETAPVEPAIFCQVGE